MTTPVVTAAKHYVPENLLTLIEAGADADAVEKAARFHRSATLDAYLAQSN